MLGSTRSHSLHSQRDAFPHENATLPMPPSSPLSNEQVIALYESLSDLSGEMLACARTQDWTTLTQLEQDCAGRIATLHVGVPVLSGESRNRKVRLLHVILSNDRAIRDITDAWMHQAWQMTQGAMPLGAAR